MPSSYWQRWFTDVPTLSPPLVTVTCKDVIPLKTTEEPQGLVWALCFWPKQGLFL